MQVSFEDFVAAVNKLLRRDGVKRLPDQDRSPWLMVAWNASTRSAWICYDPRTAEDMVRLSFRDPDFSVPIASGTKPAPAPHSEHKLDAAGVPIEVISKRLGHSDISITYDRYITFCRDRDAEAAEAFAKIVA